MFHFYNKHLFTGIFLACLLSAGSASAQQLQRVQPKWWFGESGAASLNVYRGNTQQLTSSFSVPTSFHDGQSVRPYASLLTEYRPNKRWGAMLNVAYDNRGGSFNHVMAPCNCEADLTTNLSYLTIEPAIRIAPFASAFYVFAGPTLSINLTKDFIYQQDKQTDTRADLSDIRKFVFSAQAGFGFDIPVSAKNAPVQMTVSPFASFQTDLLQEPRTSGDWSMYSVRAGLAIKFGIGKAVVIPAKPIASPKPETIAVITPRPGFIVAPKEVQFSITAPKLLLPVVLRHELLPLLNAVFFDANSSSIPGRYITLPPSNALAFTEDQLQQGEIAGSDRSKRQMNAYHHILNVLGSRMNRYPTATVSLQGNTNDALVNYAMAENIQSYLVTTFGIEASRISISKEKVSTRGKTFNRERLAEERRIDINSTSPELLTQVGELEIPGKRNTIAQETVRFTNRNAGDVLKTWSLQVVAEDGSRQAYGPYQQDEVLIPAATLLNNKTVGNYTVTMTGETKTGMVITKEAALSLASAENTKQTVPPFSILFGFDRSDIPMAYQDFLAKTIAPLIDAHATVTIFGYADATGADKYNLALSKSRVANVERLLTELLQGKAVSFKTYGFGKDKGISPFNNTLPEERFYNRTIMVGIDNGK